MSAAANPVGPPAGPQRGFLLVRRDGMLWGVSNGAVNGITRDGARFRLTVGGADLGVDEVVGVVPDLAIWPVSGALRRFWPDVAGGVAVHADAPLLIVDPRQPPRALRRVAPEDEERIEGRIEEVTEGETGDGEGRL